MSWALDEFFASVEEEFGVSIDDAEQLDTPGAVNDSVAADPQRCESIAYV